MQNLDFFLNLLLEKLSVSYSCKHHLPMVKLKPQHQVGSKFCLFAFVKIIFTCFKTKIIVFECTCDKLEFKIIGRKI